MPAPPAVNAGLHVEGAAGLPPLAVGMAEYAGPTSDSIASWRLNTQSRSHCYAAVELGAEKLLVALTASRKLQKSFGDQSIESNNHMFMPDGTWRECV